MYDPQSSPVSSILLSCNLRSCIFYLHPIASTGWHLFHFNWRSLSSLVVARLPLCHVPLCHQMPSCRLLCSSLAFVALRLPDRFFTGLGLWPSRAAHLWGLKISQMGWKCLLNIEMSWVLVQRYTVRHSNAEKVYWFGFQGWNRKLIKAFQ